MASEARTSDLNFLTPPSRRSFNERGTINYQLSTVLVTRHWVARHSFRDGGSLIYRPVICSSFAAEAWYFWNIGLLLTSQFQHGRRACCQFRGDLALCINQHGHRRARCSKLPPDAHPGFVEYDRR